jgi:hypothetical protein
MRQKLYRKWQSVENVTEVSTADQAQTVKLLASIGSYWVPILDGLEFSRMPDNRPTMKKHLTYSFPVQSKSLHSSSSYRIQWYKVLTCMFGISLLKFVMVYIEMYCL